jgi:hypothetical protein
MKHLMALGQPSVLQIPEMNTAQSYTGFAQQRTTRIIITTQGQAVAFTSHFWIWECHQFNPFTAMALYWNLTCSESHCSMQTGFWTYSIQIGNGSKEVEDITIGCYFWTSSTISGIFQTTMFWKLTLFLSSGIWGEMLLLFWAHLGELVIQWLRLAHSNEPCHYYCCCGCNLRNVYSPN